MKGLFVKDLHLLGKQKLFFLATIFLTVNLQTLVIVPLFMLFFVLSIIFTTITLDEMLFVHVAHLRQEVCGREIFFTVY